MKITSYVVTVIGNVQRQNHRLSYFIYFVNGTVIAATVLSRRKVSG